MAALDDDAHLERSRESNAAGIALLEETLGAMGIRSWPTDANFLLAETGPASYDALLRLGVIVRPMAGFGMPDCIRVTIGAPEENQKFVKALETIHEGSTH